MYCYYYSYSPVYLYTSTIVVPVKPENDHRDAEVVEPIPSLSEHTAKYCEIVKIVIYSKACHDNVEYIGSGCDYTNTSQTKQ